MTSAAYADKKPANARDSAFVFYDIESLANVFTVGVYDVAAHDVEVYCIIDDAVPGIPESGLHAALASPEVQGHLMAANPALVKLRDGENGPDGAPRRIEFFDLSQEDAALRLGRRLLGLYDSNRDSAHEGHRCPITGHEVICDTDDRYDPAVHYFVAGYNSNQYDTTMLAVFFSLAFDEDHVFSPVTAATMRRHNDAVFEVSRAIDSPPMSSYLREHRRAGAIRRNWISTGRHFDVARLNELQQRVALKRLLGMLGHQILESEKLASPNARIESFDEFVDLVAYNVSDVVGTKLLMDHPVYAGAFDLRAGLLRTYPETVFDRIGGSDYRTPDLRPRSVLSRWPRSRLTVDSSSAQFAGRILAPYRDLRSVPGHVADLPVVSYRYPDPLDRNRTGHEPSNVLTDTRDFFLATVPTDTAAGRAAHRQIEQVYTYYRRIEGLSFNHVDNERESLPQTIKHLTDVLPAELKSRFEKLFPVDGPSAFAYRDYRTLAADIAAALDRAQLPEDSIEAIRAMLRRLGAAVRAWADSAQPYWPSDQPASFDDTVVEYDSDPHHPRNLVWDLSQIARLPGNVPYFTEQGHPTSCFATFSTGGIHGAELNEKLAGAELAELERGWTLLRTALETAHAQWQQACRVADDVEAGADPADYLAEHGLKSFTKIAKIVADGKEWIPAHAETMPELLDADGQPYDKAVLAAATWWIRRKVRITVTDPDSGRPRTVEWTDVLKSSSTKDDLFLRETPKGCRDVQLFPQQRSETAGVSFPHGTQHLDNKLDQRFKYTSVADVIHEDFTSYYPLMLVNLGAFTNPDLAEAGAPPRDKYSEIFDDKERYGKLMKDPEATAEQQESYRVLREGTKLILNAASGAADARHDTPILMNNMIITMRIVGQLFSWRIGQAQTFAGGRIVSTNTDGLYSTLDDETNQRVLDEHTAAINVQIEPESLTLVSKDSNNRVEFLSAEKSMAVLAKRPDGTVHTDPEHLARRPWYRVVAAAGGGTLACWEGPNPRKALAHPAIVDRILIEYFKLIAGGYRPVHTPASVRAGFSQVSPPYSVDSVLENFQYAKLVCPPRPALSIDDPMDPEIVGAIITRLHQQLDVRELLRLYQNMIASSPGKLSYLFSTPYGAGHTALDSARLTFPGDRREVLDPAEPVESPFLQRRDDASPVSLLGHYTRVFAVRPEQVARSDRFTAPQMIGAARARKVSDNVAASRKAAGARLVNTPDPVAAHLLDAASEDSASLAGSRDIILARHSGVDPAAPMLVFNETIADHPDEGLLRQLLDCVDVEVYAHMAMTSYQENWQNR